MAVKVMHAPALVPGGVDQRRKEPRAEPKTKPRRRSSVYDADGNEVFITLICLKCHKIRPLSQFGLRKMADGAIRNQPWCKTCRTGASAENPKRDKVPLGEGALAEAPLPHVPPAASDPAIPRAESVLDSGTLAAQVVAALHGGRR